MSANIKMLEEAKNYLENCDPEEFINEFLEIQKNETVGITIDEMFGQVDEKQHILKYLKHKRISLEEELSNHCEKYGEWSKIIKLSDYSIINKRQYIVNELGKLNDVIEHIQNGGWFQIENMINITTTDEKITFHEEYIHNVI